MPQIDMPLDKLQQYQGRNPMPADFDAFWDRGLEEIRRLDPQVELKPAAFQSRQAECFDLWFTSTFGARVHAKYLRPRQRAGRAPCLLQFHGFTGHCGEWNDKLGLVAEGFCVAALDCRGQGGESQDHGLLRTSPCNGHLTRGLSDSDPANLLYRNLYLDTALLARVVCGFAEVDPDRLGAMGGSQGGGLTLACAGLVPGIRKAAPVYPFLCDWKRVWEMDLAKDAYNEIRDYFRRFDPLHQREDELWNRLGYIDVQFLARRIKASVMMGVGLMDAICPPSTQYAAYNKIAAPKQTVIYPDFGHEGLPGHNDRVFQFLKDL